MQNSFFKEIHISTEFSLKSAFNLDLEQCLPKIFCEGDKNTEYESIWMGIEPMHAKWVNLTFCR